MKENKLIKRAFAALVLLFASIPILISAVSYTTTSKTITTFSNGSTTFSISFPPGGGTNTDATVIIPKVGADGSPTIITSAEVDMVSAGAGGEIGTPYIWIPNTGSRTLAQLRTSDGTLVKLYQNSADGFPANAFSGHSRITVIPGGDVYVANRRNQYITRLTPQAAPSEEYDYGGQLDMGAGETYIRAVTFDKNGYIWGGTCGSASGIDKLRVFCGMNTTDPNCAAGFDTMLAESTNALNGLGKCHYGAIGDGYGFVWTVGGEVRSYSYDAIAKVITGVDTDAVLGSYGIGMDNDQNIWIGRIGGGGVYKISRNAAGNITNNVLYPNPFLTINTGIAADGTTPLGNVWTAGWVTGKVSRFKTDGTFIANYDSGIGNPAVGGPHGIAIDFNNNAWVVNYSGGAPPGKTVSNPSACAGVDSVIGIGITNGGAGYTVVGTTVSIVGGGGAGATAAVTSVSATGAITDIAVTSGGAGYTFAPTVTIVGGDGTATAGAVLSGSVTKFKSDGTFIDTYTTCGNNPYNYSDMTGFRSIPKTLIVGGSEFTISDTTFSGFEAALQAVLNACTTFDGINCEIPLTITSIQGGNFTLQNLQIVYQTVVPLTSGGLVPCGREFNDGSTPWDDTAPCNLCHLILMVQLIIEFLVKLSAIVAIFAIALGGLLYIFSSGNQSRIQSAKSGIKYALIGFVIIFIAWAVIATLLTMLGYIDPMNGEWYMMSCDLPT